MPTDDHDVIIRMESEVRAMAGDLAELKKRFDEYVTRVEFAPVKMIAFGLAISVLSGVLVAVLNSVIRH